VHAHQLGENQRSGIKEEKMRAKASVKTEFDPLRPHGRGENDLKNGTVGLVTSQKSRPNGEI